MSGIGTETDIVRALAERRDPSTTQVAEFMSGEPVTTRPDEDTAEAALRMVEGGFRHLPVIDDGRLVGMLSARDLLEVEAWPVADQRGRDVDSIDHPVRPTRHRLVGRNS